MTNSTDLLKYVLTHTTKGNTQDVINAIDTYCSSNWMMNVGDVKGLILDTEVIKKKPARVLEIGTYCGYSAIRIARLLNDDAHLVTLEINKNNAKIAQQMIDHSGVSSKITVVVSDLKEYIHNLKDIEPFDLVFIDHWKDQYLPDFKLLETSGLLKCGTVIVADNILYPGAPDYKDYLMSNDKYDNVCHETLLEYTTDIEDQVLVSTKLS